MGLRWIVATGFCLTAGLGLQAADAEITRELFNSRITVDVARNKASRVEGGDFDDKTDKVSFKVKLTSRDPNRSFDGLKLELYVFGQSMVSKKAYKLLQRATQTCSVGPLQQFVYESPQVVSMWDDTNAIFGEKYKGWYLLVKGPKDEILLEKSVISIFDDTKGLGGLREGDYYDRKMQPVKVGRY